mmetsp:Transcript_89449/g.154838  ORF Transcript_89449/g.154838 Transcript_89449/m.154838 type:complete len:84 (-) Transcript_89449:27-278(-)
MLCFEKVIRMKLVLVLLSILAVAMHLHGCGGCELVEKGGKTCKLDVSADCCEGLKDSEGPGSLSCINEDDIHELVETECGKDP